MDKIRVEFLGGESRWNCGLDVNYMMAEVETDDDTIELYAECTYEGTEFDKEPFDVDGFDDYSYPILKEEIIRQAEENGIDVNRLVF